MTEHLFDPTQYERRRVGHPDWAYDVAGPDDAIEYPPTPGPHSIAEPERSDDDAIEYPPTPGPHSIAEPERSDDNAIEYPPTPGPHSIHRCVGQYWAGGTAAPGNFYFRYSYRTNTGRQVHVHIPGGNIHNPDAKDHARQVEAAAAAGKSTAEILALIGSWNRCDRKKPPF